MRGWLELYLSIATECARSTEAEETISGNSAAIVGKMSDSRRELNLPAKAGGVQRRRSQPSRRRPSELEPGAGAWHLLDPVSAELVLSRSVLVAAHPFLVGDRDCRLRLIGRD